MTKTNRPINVDIFVDHLSYALDEADIFIDNLHPCWIKHYETKEDGFMFMQKEEDRETTVQVFKDRFEFVNSHQALMMNNEFTPVKAAIMFAIAIINSTPIVPPPCPCCAEREVSS